MSNIKQVLATLTKIQHTTLTADASHEYADAVATVFVQTLNSMKRAPQIENVEIHENEFGYVSATILVAEDSLDVFGLPPTQFGVGHIGVELMTHQNGNVNIRITAEYEDTEVEVDVANHKYRLKKTPETTVAFEGLAVQLAVPVARVPDTMRA